MNSTPLEASSIPPNAHLIVMDSGAGGLNVLRTLLNAQLGCPVTFIADSAWMPYGEKDSAVLRDRLLKLVRHMLIERGYTNPYLLFACNTASAVWEGVDPAHFGSHGIRPDRVIDILRPTIALLMRELIHVQKQSPQKTPIQVGLLATALTVSSNVYPNLAEVLYPFSSSTQLRWASVACHSLAQAVEGDTTQQPLNELLETYTSLLKPLEPQAVILGCTHYLKLKKDIQETLPTTTLIDPSEALVYVIRQRLGLPLEGNPTPSPYSEFTESLELLETGTSPRLSDYCQNEIPELAGFKFKHLALM
jgi:glutamate racemase